MQLLDYLELKNQNIPEFLTDAGWFEGLSTQQIDALKVRVWRHAHGKRRPSPEDINRYSEATKGAVRVEDWHELALRQLPPPGDRAEPVVAAS